MNYLVTDAELRSVADAIRDKAGVSDDITFPVGFVDTIGDISGGGDLPEEALLITGNCNYRFANNGWNWFIENYGNQIRTDGIQNANQMFYQCDKLTKIPFDINFYTVVSSMNSMFSNCNKLTELPKLSKGSIDQTSLSQLFYGCHRLRYIPDDYIVTSDFTISSNRQCSGIISECRSLREVPQFIKDLPLYTSSTSSPYYPYGINGLYSLNELKNLQPPLSTNIITSNLFQNFLIQAERLKAFTFALDDNGNPKVCKMKGQTIDFSNYVGSVFAPQDISQYNSGITADKEVKDAESYQRLKDDPDWFTLNPLYSRYNHDSAVETINSLPDTSAYLATAGGTNTIKFGGRRGELTDGGAINTLTPEEIAVASAKGWTVTLV